MSKGGDFRKIKIGSFNKFKSNNYKVSPYEKFYVWAYSKANGKLGSLLHPPNGIPPGYKIDVSSFAVNSKDLDILDDLVLKWLDRHYYHDPKTSKAGLNWMKFDLGPCITSSPEGYVYLKKNLLTDR